jgi:hypothetical protein
MQTKSGDKKYENPDLKDIEYEFVYGQLPCDTCLKIKYHQEFTDFKTLHLFKEKWHLLNYKNYHASCSMCERFDQKLKNEKLIKLRKQYYITMEKDNAYLNEVCNRFSLIKRV